MISGTIIAKIRTQETELTTTPVTSCAELLPTLVSGHVTKLSLAADSSTVVFVSL